MKMTLSRNYDYDFILVYKSIEKYTCDFCVF